MKYKAINKATNEEHICSKVVIEGFDYYVSNDEIKESNWVYNPYTEYVYKADFKLIENSKQDKNFHIKKVIATNNPNIDLPQVIDEIEELANNYAKTFIEDDGTCEPDFTEGYNKSQETHPFSENDMIEFAEWLRNDSIANIYFYYRGIKENGQLVTNKELLELWKEQQIKTVYYEQY